MIATGSRLRGLKNGMVNLARRLKPQSKSDWGMVAGGTLLGTGIGTTIVHDRNTNNRDMHNLNHMLLPTPDPRNQAEDKQELLNILNRQTNVTLPGLPLATPRLNNYSNVRNLRTIGNRKLFEVDRNGTTQTFVIGSDPNHLTGRQVGLGTLVNLNDYWRHRQAHRTTHEEALRHSSVLGNGQGRNPFNRWLVPDETNTRGDIALQFVNGNVNIGLDGSMNQGNLDTVVNRFGAITLDSGQNLRDFLRQHGEAFQVAWHGRPTQLAVASLRNTASQARTTLRFNENGSLTLFKTDPQGRFLGNEHIEQVAPGAVKARLEELMKTHTAVPHHGQ
jgi:hypothetical protein